MADINKNCLLCGVGGQGTVLASKLIAFSAMNKGKMVRTAETIGMAQRGGCVVSHVRIGDKVYSPLIPMGAADVIIGFEPAEAVRCLPYLKKGGVVVVSKKPVKPVTSTLENDYYNGDEMLVYLRENTEKLIEIDTEKLCAECGSAKVLNVILLGAAVASGEIGISVEDIKNAILNRVHEKFHQLNLKALELGTGCL